MELLFLFSSLLFGGDVNRLGDPTFHVRHEATKRLTAVGWPAYPSLLRGAASNNPERAVRSADLLDALDGWLFKVLEAEGVARGVSPLPLDASPAFLRAVCKRVDQLGGWRTDDAWEWAERKPYRTGTRWEDVDYVVRSAAASRLFQDTAK